MEIIKMNTTDDDDDRNGPCVLRRPSVEHPVVFTEWALARSMVMIVMGLYNSLLMWWGWWQCL